MDNEIQLISDGVGLAVIGDPTQVDSFLASEGMQSKDLNLGRLSLHLGTAAAAMQAGSEISANSARWVKLTAESAQQIKRFGLRKSLKTGLSTGALKGDGGQIKGFVEFVKGPGALVSNPAILAGAAGLMAQLSNQQAMNEITDYLDTIGEKVDDLLRGQKHAVLAGMIGVDFVIDDALSVREQLGRVPEITWSKVQATSMTIASTEAYALLQLDAVAEKLEQQAKIGGLATATNDAKVEVPEWLAVLARCLRLQDAITVLELDRVLDSSPDELDRHRLALQDTRQNRLERIARSTERLLARMDAAIGTANLKILLHPTTARAVADSSGHVTTAIVDFHQRAGIGASADISEARRWMDAAVEVRDRVLATGGAAASSVVHFGSDTYEHARSTTSKLLSSGVADRALRRGEVDKECDEQPD